MIEDHDALILAHLQKDGRATNQQLADQVGMSTSACWRRVRALEESGVIRGYAALVAREQAGFCDVGHPPRLAGAARCQVCG